MKYLLLGSTCLVVVILTYTCFHKKTKKQSSETYKKSNMLMQRNQSNQSNQPNQPNQPNRSKVIYEPSDVGEWQHAIPECSEDLCPEFDQVAYVVY